MSKSNDLVIGHWATSKKLSYNKENIRKLVKVKSIEINSIEIY